MRADWLARTAVSARTRLVSSASTALTSAVSASAKRLPPSGSRRPGESTARRSVSFRSLPSLSVSTSLCTTSRDALENGPLMYAVVCHAEHDSTHMGFTGRWDIVPPVCSLGHASKRMPFVPSPALHSRSSHAKASLLTVLHRA
ncbi:hypothetical protein VTO73DRAFT_1459 [Trametes versicolor]